MLLRYLLLLLLALLPIKSFALIEVDITRGNLSPLPVAVSPLSIDVKSEEGFKKILMIENLGSEISAVVENNLKQSGLFNPLNKDAFLQKPDIAHLKPRFEDWNLIKAQALITGKVSLVDEKLRVEFRLWDVLGGKEMMALAFTTVPSNWRRVGHIITDKVYERLTGEKGYFDTRIIYVAEEGPKINRIKKLRTLLNKTKWTSKAPYAATCPLTLEWIDKQYRPEEYEIPKYITEIFLSEVYNEI